MFRFVLTVLVVIVTSLFPAKCTASASGFAIGNICLEGVRAEIVPNQSMPDAKGQWADATYVLEASGELPLSAHFVLFRRPMLSYKQFPSCDNITKLEANRQNQPVLAGTLTTLDIKARIFTATSGSNRVQIDVGKFNATLTTVTSMPGPAHGGTVDLRGASSLILVNSKTILIDSASGTGTIEMSSSGLAIANARIGMLGGADLTTTVAPESATAPEVFAVGISDGQFSLVEGILSGIPSRHLNGAVLDSGAASLMTPDLVVKEVEIAATRAATAVTLTSLSGQSAHLLAGGAVLKFDMTSPKLSMQRISGSGSRKPEAVFVGAPVIESMRATAESAQTITGTGGTILAGAAVLDIAKAGKNEIMATSTWTKPNVAAADFFLPSSTVKTAHLNLSGTLNALSVSGDIDSTVQRLQTITATDRLPIQIARAKITNEIRLPIRTNANNLAGSIAVADQDQSGVLIAGLDHFHLEGVLIIDLNDVKKTRAEFPIDGVQVGLQAMVATQPFIAGTTPAFAAVGVTGRNRTPITLGATRSGLFDVSVGTVTLGQPIIRVGQSGSQVRASLELNSTGLVLITSDIATGALLLTRGTFEARGADGSNGIEFHLLEAGKWLDLGGTRVVDPVLKVKTLSLHVDKTQAVEVGIGDITGISANASSINKPVDPAHPSEVTYIGKLAEPFTIDEFAAAHVDIGDVLTIESATITTLNLHITGADVLLGGDAHITNGDLKIGVVNLQEFKVDDTTTRMLQQAHMAISGNIDPGSGLGVNNAPSFGIDVVASGQSDKLKGDGSAHLGGFSGFVETSFDTGFRCYPDGANPGDTFKPPFELNLAVTAIDLSAHLRDGRFSAEGQPGPFALLAHTKGHSDCNGKLNEYVLIPAHTAWTYGVCTKGFPIVEFYQCKWEVPVPKVSFGWHPHAQVEFAELSLGMTAPVVRLNEGALHLCNIGKVEIPPGFVVMAVVPNFDTSYPGATDIINNLLDVTFVAEESAAANALINGVGWTVSSFATGLGNLMCIR
jgi:hypothetical protein